MALHKKWSEELESDLMAPFPDEMVKVLSSTGARYVDLMRYPERLNRLVGPGGWEVDIVRRDDIGDNMIMDLAITILGVRKVNTGDEINSQFHPSLKKDDWGSKLFGSPTTNAYAQAFKRCCTLGFGMALTQLYDKSNRNDALPHTTASAGGPQDDIPCPKCGGAMWDNRKDKTNDKAPDFKCAEKNGECKDGSYPTSIWWDKVVEELNAKVKSAVTLEIMDAEQGMATVGYGKDGDAPRTFKAIKWLNVELEKSKLTPTAEPDKKLFSEPDDDLPF